MSNMASSQCAPGLGMGVATVVQTRMNPESSARISCERPLDSEVADRIEAALSDPAIEALLIEFHCRPGNARRARSTRSWPTTR